MSRLRMCGLLSLVLGFASVLPAAAAEMRGLWVDAFHPGFRSPSETAEMVATAKQCNFNALFVQVRKRGDVYYRSAMEPMDTRIAAGYDPLADIVAKAHAAGLQVHAWISVYEVHHVDKWSRSKASLHTMHQDWLTKDSQGGMLFPGEVLYLDPGVPEVRKYMVDLVDEIVKGYDVDGIHLDVVRYPGMDSGYNETSVTLFNKSKGRSGKPDRKDSAWDSWRKSQITAFVKAASQALSGGKRRIQLSASVSANKNDAHWHLFQEWDAWLKTGLLDFVVPMVFPIDNRVFESSMVESTALADGRPIYIGQGGWKMPTEQSLEQIGIVRKAGIKGTVVYSYYYCSKAHEGSAVSLMDALKAGPFAEPADVPVLGRK